MCGCQFSALVFWVEDMCRCSLCLLNLILLLLSCAFVAISDIWFEFPLKTLPPFSNNNWTSFPSYPPTPSRKETWGG